MYIYIRMHSCGRKTHSELRRWAAQSKGPSVTLARLFACACAAAEGRPYVFACVIYAVYIGAFPRKKN